MTYFRREQDSATAWMFCARCHETLGRYIYFYNGLPYCSQSCAEKAISEETIQDKLESITDKYKEN